jgi:hypothetical protein
MSTNIWLKVRAGTTGKVAVYGFPRLPIGIGRHPDNDLQLEEGSVSSFHARLIELSGQLCIVDLASTNGIRVPAAGAGQTRIVSQVPHELEAHGFEFFVGSCRISVESSHKRWLPPRLALPSLPVLSSLGWPSELGVVGGPPLGQRALRASVSSEPGEPRALETCQLELEPERVAFQGLRELALSLVPGLTLETAGDVARLITRLHASVELLCRCFVQLQAGYAGFRSGLRVPGPEGRPVASEHRLDLVDHPHHAAEMLLDWRASAGDAAGAMEARLADVAVHQVAILDGVMQGVMALLAELAPERVEAEAARRHPQSLFRRPGRYRACWQTYQERHAELCWRDSALKHVFGEAFGEAYAAYGQRAAAARTGG